MLQEDGEELHFSPYSSGEPPMATAFTNTVTVPSPAAYRSWLQLLGPNNNTAPPLDVEEFKFRFDHVSDLRNAQIPELDLEDGFTSVDIDIPVAFNNNGRLSTGSPESYTDSIKARIYSPRLINDSIGPFPLVVYYRGGGWVTGSLETEDVACREIAKLRRQVILSVDYRKAPKHVWPIPHRDCWDALVWAARHAEALNVDLENRGFVVGGDSVGGLMAAAVAMEARDTQLSPPLSGLLLRAPILIHPKRAASFPGEALHSLIADVEYPVHSRESVERTFELYAVPDKDTSNYRISPLLASSFGGLPPTYIQICELDPHRDEAYRFQQKIDAAGGRSRIDVYRGMPHSFWALPRMPGTAAAVQDLCLGLQWTSHQQYWDTGIREEVIADTSAWVLKSSAAEGLAAWRDKKLCTLKGCGCNF